MMGCTLSERHWVYTCPPWERVSVPEDLPYQVHWALFFGLRSTRRAPLRPLNAMW